MGDDYFFGPAGGTPGPQQPAPQQQPGLAQPFPGGAAPGMPGYSWQQSQQVQAQVLADAGPAVPMSGLTILAGVAGLSSLVMMVASWGPWVKLSVFTESQSVGGLHSGVDGRYVLALGFAALLAAGAVLTTGQQNLQLRQIYAGVLVALGAVGLGVVIHEWVTVSDQFRRANEFLDTFANSFNNNVPPGTTNPFAGGAGILRISKGWGLTLSGVASAVTGLAGGYLFVVK